MYEFMNPEHGADVGASKRYSPTTLLSEKCLPGRGDVWHAAHTVSGGNPCNFELCWYTVAL